MGYIERIGFGAFFVSSLVIGTRLLLLARRTGQIPELLIGVAVLGIGPLGYGLSILAFRAGEHATIVSATLRGSGFLAVFIGAASQYLFVWHVFRRWQRWTRPVVYLAIALLAASYVGDIAANGLVNRTIGGGWFWIGMALRVLAMAWCSAESLHYWGLMRRRWRIGLADPVMMNRFFLWGVGSGMAFLGSTLLVVVMAIGGFSARDIPAVNLIVSMHGLVAAVAMWLAFQPPAFYLRFIESRGRLPADAIPSPRT